jgi:HemK-related putative methylase
MNKKNKKNFSNNKYFSNKNYSTTVYDPQEDSFLLAETVKKFAKGNVLDVGTGSGIQGIEALKSRAVESVVFVDINSNAIDFVKKEFETDDDLKKILESKNISFIVSDLYSKLSLKKYSKKFDTIIFNPPYLPDDELDGEKLITTGGEEGWEIYDEFLKKSDKYLSQTGQILLLFSSLTNKDKIDEIIRKYTYSKNLIVKKGLFMEQLYVYQIKKINKNIFYGHRGIVEIKTIRLKNKNMRVAIKQSLHKDYSLEVEAKFLKILNKKNIGPKLYSYNKKNNSITMEYIFGKRIEEYIETCSYADMIRILLIVLKQLLIMESLGINKFEMTNPYKHIIISGSGKHLKVKMIDFERCTYTERPKNITQFIQYLCSGKFRNILSKKNIFVDVEALRNIAKSYNKTIVEKDLCKKIISCIKN